MLPHWLSLTRQELTICIRPSSLILRRFTQRIGAKAICVDQKKIVLTQTIHLHDIDPAYLIKLLNKVLSDPRWATPTLKVILSEHFVRYAVIPWNTAISNEDERQAFVAHHFKAIYGEPMSDWHHCLSPVKYGQASLASAIPKTLLQAIDDGVTSHNISLTAVEPYLMTVTGQVMQVIKQQSLASRCCLAVVTDDRLSLAMIVDKQWQWIRCVQQTNDVSSQINTLLQREALLNEAMANVITNGMPLPLLVHWPDKSMSEAIQLQHVRVIRLTAESIFVTEKDAPVARLIAS